MPDGIGTICGIYRSLRPGLPGKQLEVSAQHKMKFAAVRSTIWKYSLAFLPLFPYQEKSFPGTEPTSGLGEMYCACREGHHETPLCLALSRGREPQGPGPSCPPACSPWGLGQVNPFSGLSWDFSSSEKCHPGYKSLDFYLSCLATATNNLMWNLPP